MRSLGKLQDLVDLAETPLVGSSSTTTSGQPKGEVVELNDDDEEQEEDMSGIQYNPGEVNLGLG